MRKPRLGTFALIVFIVVGSCVSDLNHAQATKTEHLEVQMSWSADRQITRYEMADAVCYQGLPNEAFSCYRK